MTTSSAKTPRPTPRHWRERVRENADAARVLADEDTGLGRPGRSDTTGHISLDGTRAPRPRVTVAKSFAPVLTYREKYNLKNRHRVRVGFRWGRMLETLKNTEMTITEFVESLDNEELARGQLRDKNGRFSGRPPEWVPREFYKACLRELHRRGQELWRVNYIDAIKAMTAIATGQVKGVTGSERLRAAQYVIERIEGKIPEVVTITQDSPWEGALVDIVAEVSDEQITAARRVLAGEIIIDGEVVPDAPTPPPDPQPRRRTARVARQRAR